jgi:hypothetical protein
MTKMPQTRPDILFIMTDQQRFDTIANARPRSRQRFAQEKGIKILSLPTGQGLVVKPVAAKKITKSIR